jgi:hypothetical protein
LYSRKIFYRDIKLFLESEKIDYLQGKERKDKNITMRDWIANKATYEDYYPTPKERFNTSLYVKEINNNKGKEREEWIKDALVDETPVIDLVKGCNLDVNMKVSYKLEWEEVFDDEEKYGELIDKYDSGEPVEPIIFISLLEWTIKEDLPLAEEDLKNNGAM